MLLKTIHVKDAKVHHFSVEAAIIDELMQKRKYIILDRKGAKLLRVGRNCCTFA